jgi:hypothetical protein
LNLQEENPMSRSASRSTFVRILAAPVLALWLGSAVAALPKPPETPESKAQAEEAKAKAAAAAKKAAEDLAAAMDRAVANYQANKNK